MQLTCVSCGQPIPANKINIHKMLAVCPHCDAVFAFDSPASSAEQQKNKHRKIKQPPHIIQHEDNEKLALAFRTNFRLDRDGDLMGLLILAGIFGFFSVLTFLRAPLILSSGFMIVTLLMMYTLALRLYNRTQITVSDAHIHVSRQPLFNPFQHINQIDLHDVTSIHYEETATSQREQYDTPRYRVYAMTTSGRERIIVNDVIEEYAVYIAQQLKKSLHASFAYDSAIDADDNLAEYDTSRLITDADSHDDETPLPNLGSLIQSSDKSK